MRLLLGTHILLWTLAEIEANDFNLNLPRYIDGLDAYW